MGTEDWVFKGTKFITYTKKQRLKIQRLDFQKYNIKERRRKKKESQELFKKQQQAQEAFALKIGSFFFEK